MLAPNFLFENYEPSGDGPESLHALVDACVGRPALVSAAAKCLEGLAFYGAAGLAPQPHPKAQTLTSSADPNPNQVGAGAEVGLATVRTLDAMYRSAKSGRAEACL